MTAVLFRYDEQVDLLGEAAFPYVLWVHVHVLKLVFVQYHPEPTLVSDGHPRPVDADPRFPDLKDLAIDLVDPHKVETM
jgi:hypothetical protein